MSTPPLPPSEPPEAPPHSPYAPPAAGGPPPEGPRLPWEERDRLGFFEALIQTIRLLVTDPSDGFSRLRQDGDLTSPILFGIILSWLSMLLSQMWQVLFGGLYRGFFEQIEGLEGAFAPPGLGSLIAVLVLWPLIYIVFLFVFAALFHLCLMLVGATDRSPTGFEGTLKVYAYSHVAGLATVIPLFGSLVYLIWTIVLDVIGFAVVHRTTQGRALVAVLIPIVVCCLCGILLAAFFGAMLAAFLASVGGHTGS